MCNYVKSIGSSLFQFLIHIDGMVLEDPKIFYKWIMY